MLYLGGINFSSQTRTIDGWKVNDPTSALPK